LTQPSRIFDLWRRMYTRFAIEPFPAQVTESPQISTIVQPVTDADVLLRTTTCIRFDNQDIQAATSFFTLYTVPDRTRTYLVNVHMEGTTASSQLGVRIGGVTTYISLFATDEKIWLGRITLDVADEFGVLTTGNAGDSARDIDIIIETEDAF